MNSEKKYIFLVLVHIALGLLLYTISPFSRVYFFAIIGYFSFRIIVSSNDKRPLEVLTGCAYLIGSEVILRMTDGAIFYEATKYFVIFFSMLGIFYNGVSGKGYPYFLYLIALIPAILVASTTLSLDANFRTNIAFVLSGPVCLGIAALYCYDRKLAHEQVLDIVLYVSLPIISMATYLFLYNPSVKDTLSGTGSNFATSGGFGPNQVSSILGLGIFALTVRLFLKSPTLILKIVNILLLCAISFRALVTFSRGGVLSALIVIFAFLYILYINSSYRRKNKIIMSFILFIAAASVTWIISSNQTTGLIDKRYANQNELGVEKDDISTGRTDLFEEELEGFMESPFFGVGASRMKDRRIESLGRAITSHNEISRVLSEHGMMGVFIILILIFTPIAYRSTNKRNYYFYAFLCFWFATINHSAMRIAAPAFVYALSLLNVTHVKPPLHRKPIK